MTSLSLTQQQRLQAKLSPTQIQVIKLLELPSCDLQQRINEELQENPALEEGRDPEEVQAETIEEEDFYEEDDYTNPLQNDEFNYDDYVNDDETPDYAGRQRYDSSDQPNDETLYQGSASFVEYLKQQVYLTKMTKPQRHIAKWVLGNIDEDGFLRRSVEQLVDDLAFQEGLVVSDEEMADIVGQIKDFDPPGVASATLQECLLKQLSVKPQTPSVVLAQQLLADYFDDFSQHRFDRISAKLNIDDEALKQAIDEIVHLNQKPANHISHDYEDMLKTYSDTTSKDKKDAARFIKNKIDAANWFIEAIKQRNETLTRTMSAILRKQRDYFLEGDEMALKPMILQDIADVTGYDVSTISRVCNSKYVQTEFGVFPLKHFFSESLTNAEGEEVSTKEIKLIMTELVSNEDKSNPLNDDALVQALADKGYSIARRTVAKYREQLDIPVARLRKQL